MKKINEQKLQAFDIGAMGKRPLSRREQEERRKREEETAAAHAFKEFVETFQEAPSTVSKVWVKAGVYDAGTRRTYSLLFKSLKYYEYLLSLGEDNREKGKLYKPTAKEEKSSAEKAQEYAKLLSTDTKTSNSTTKKKTHEKKKSVLESFKEELRQIQEEREERHKYKSIAKTILQAPEPDLLAPRDNEFGSMDNGDPNTTNIYLGNLNPKISEQQLMELFGRYGPLASIKIMWPRSEEEKSRGRNCGFVAYMSRVDAERALKNLNGRDVMGYEMKLGWGKSVTILNHPIFIPPALVEHVMPPPPSGLPFNAQPQLNDIANFPPKEYFLNYSTDPDIKRDMEEIAYKCIVKVMIPTERPLLALVHRMIEFVVREGPMFEAMIMRREIDNPIFRFLFENESPAHIYYRWKLFSLLQGDTPTEWRQKEFRMFRKGAIWKPPALNFYTQGMPEELISDDGAPECNKGALSTAQRDRLEDLIRHLTPERSKIGDAMIFCIEHAEAADEICECIEESMSSLDTLVSKKIARLYLISDILHNCSVKVSNASFFRKSMENHLEQVFTHLRSSFMALESRLKAEGFKMRVLQVFKAWEDWTVYPRDYLTKLKHIFLGLSLSSDKPSDIDGNPISDDEKDDEDLDGVPLDGAALLKSALIRGIPGANPAENRMREMDRDSEDDDIDGVPFDDDIDGIPLEKLASSSTGLKPGGFIPSKWETVDPDQIEAQAITTSKWDTLDNSSAPDPPALSEVSTDGSFDNDPRDLDEEKRSRLKKIEVKVLQYQDELESGIRQTKPGWTIDKQIQHYRHLEDPKNQKDHHHLCIQNHQGDVQGNQYHQRDRSNPNGLVLDPTRVQDQDLQAIQIHQENMKSVLDTGKSSRRLSPDRSRSARDIQMSPVRYTKSPRHRSDKHRKHKY
ncbi:U2 snRNP-associated SURP motif-containing protein [Pseudolycoriella hygida]|uniref:U2 snRNP-associated SURP motif-containing protein n=1 Tax=Pseudolycoriella hygida TaxID=35572 RepID=A0A9Q0N3I6_9DIPT|nr:U2 snRNP-associated SURP motif-containing protein [Pseudolycoriella hygida]